MPKKTSSKLVSAPPETAPASASLSGRRLVVSVPILVAVLFSITYLQMHTPMATPTTSRSTVKAAGASAATLQVATPSAAKLEPLPVTVEDNLGVPTPMTTGDVNAAATAQPTTAGLQAPTAQTPSDSAALQAHKHSQPLEELMKLL